MIRIAIVEDEEKQAKQLEDFLTRYGKEYGVAFSVSKFGDGLAFLEHFHADHDIVLMDIEMPFMDGMKAARRMREIDANVSLIFITNMAQYAIKGYEVDALAYMLKPVAYTDFAFKLQKAINASSQNRKEEIVLKIGQSLKVLRIRDIYYLEIVRHSLQYHTDEGVFEVWDKPLAQMEEMLAPYGFARCNSCYLVNLRHVKQVDGGDVVVGGDRLKMSRNKKQEFLEKLALYVGGVL